MTSPVPMVTLVKTMDVSRLRKVSRKTGIKFTVLLCWCIGKAASRVDEFFLLPTNGKLYQYDQLAINIVVQNCKGGLSLCDVPFSDNIRQFNADYLELTTQAAKTCESTSLEDRMIVGGNITYVEYKATTNRDGYYTIDLPVALGQQIDDVKAQLRFFKEQATYGYYKSGTDDIFIRTDAWFEDEANSAVQEGHTVVLDLTLVPVEGTSHADLTIK